jgi:hypothetical protein
MADASTSADQSDGSQKHESAEAKGRKLMKDGESLRKGQEKFFKHAADKKEETLKKWSNSPEMRKRGEADSECPICGKTTYKMLYDETDADSSGHTATIRYYQCSNDPDCGVLCINNPAFR